jgi:PAS domain S-box-containing protein
MPDQEPTSSMPELEALLCAKEAAAVLDSILGFTPSGVLIAGAPDGKILRVSNYVSQMLGHPRSDLEGKTLEELMKLVPGYDETGRLLALNERPLHIAMQGATVIGHEIWLDAAYGERIPVISSAAPIRNSRGDLIGAINSVADLRPHKELERSLREAVTQRETLYKELAHRVKNHLQMMTALISLEARDPKISAKGMAELIKTRLQTLAAVYRGMDESQSASRIEARSFFEAVCRPYASDGVSVETDVAPDLTLTSEQAGPVGMLANEAVCNSQKHAFHGRGGGGHIRVSLRRLQPGRLRLEVADDGTGWGSVDPNQPSHGLDLLRLFARELRSGLELGDSPSGGALVAVEFPEAVE